MTTHSHGVTTQSWSYNSVMELQLIVMELQLSHGVTTHNHEVTTHSHCVTTQSHGIRSTKKEESVVSTEEEDDDKVTEIMQILEELVGKVIEESGTTIKALKAKSKTYIKIENFKERGIDTEAAFITGACEAVAKARNMIQKIIDETDPKKQN